MAATEIRSWLKKFSDPNFPWKTLEEEVDFDEEEEEDEQDSDVVDPLAVDPLLGWQKQVQKVEGGRKGLGGLPEGKVWVGLHCGSEFQGRVEEGKREGDCRVTCLASGIRLLQASYYQVYVLGALLDLMRLLRTNLRVTPDWRRRMVVGGRASAWKGDGMAWSESSTAKKWSNSLAGVLFRF